MLIEVSKSEKNLRVFENNILVAAFPIGIGKVEAGQKEYRDDQKTPEGEYSVCVRNDKSKFHLSLGLNYPNKEDAKRALANQRITHGQFDSILKAIDAHGGSDWSTPIGGEIYIHGGLEDKNWSEGCIRMYNKDIELIFNNIKIGTVVKIRV